MERTISAPVESLIPLVKSGLNWEKYERRFPGGKLLTVEDGLSRFVAERLAKQLLSIPSAISLRVVHASKERIYVDGIVQKGAEVDRVEGDIEWKRVRPLSKEGRFRGYVRINPEAERERALRACALVVSLRDPFAQVGRVGVHAS
jgi:hypothetical protein